MDKESKRQNTEIKGYTILGKIAKGGMGEVYRGIHQGLNKEVILKKLISKAPPTFYERFRREATIMMEISHPNVVHLFDYFKEDDSSYIVMEYVAGFNLSEIIRKFGKVPVYLACYIAYEIAKGLECAHQKEIIHRDIKPANVLISNRGEIKLTDFGIAFKSSREEEEAITKKGALLGTPAYMSPEQISSSKDVDTRTDLYALGVIMYEMLSGVKPFTNEFSMENVVNIKKGKRKRLRSLNKNVPYTLNAIINKMLNPKKNKRYRNITEFKRVIEKFILFKFKDINSIKDKFALLIGDNENKPDLKEFDYSNIVIVLTLISAVASPAAAAIIILLFLRMFFPGVLFSFLFPNYYGLVGINIVDNREIKYYDLKIIDYDNRTFFKKKGLTDKEKLTLDNIALRPNQYKVELDIRDKKYVTDLVARSYKTSGKKTVDFKIANVEKTLFSVYSYVYDDLGAPANNCKLYYRSGVEKGWNILLREMNLLNGTKYDFKATSDGYFDAYINGIDIPREQKSLALKFYLIEKNAKVNLLNPYIDLDMKINGGSKYLLDQRGLKTGSIRKLSKDKTIFLKKGVYKFDFYNKKKNIRESFKISLNKGDERDLLFKYDEINNKLHIEAK
ncbi:MAG TPA: serine/threonine-protein kinase [Spirochaetota bacterium]|jgi:serine/threonine-protein kinase|nr:MAG: Serine/threonine-protein kinase PrkC [Spirochaetes bacterium ADurb.Bin133]HPY88386.1 serine/threonine-protein kinase [Spirochaetota bacterium]